MASLDPQIHPLQGAVRQNPDLRRPLRQLGLAALLGAAPVAAVAAALAGVGHPVAVPLSLAGYLAGAGLALTLMQRGFPHGELGLCNLVTLVRLGLAAALLAPLAAGSGPGWAVVALAALALALDGVDGWLARRDGRASAFGARFDMEVDSALALILAANAWASGATGAGVLAIGLPRYVFAVAASAWPWLAAPLPERFGRKAVCVLQLATLIALQLPVLPQGLAGALVAVTTLALAWSFGRDVIWLHRGRS